MTASARARLRPLSVSFPVVPLPVSLQSIPLAPNGPLVGVGGGGPSVGQTVVGIVATDVLTSTLDRVLHVPARAVRLENYARAIAAVDAGLVQLDRANRAEAQLRSMRDSCSSSIARSSAPYPLVYSPAQGWGQYYTLPGYAPSLDFGSGYIPSCAYQFVLPAGSQWQTPPISIAPYHSLDSSIAAYGIGIDATSKVVPLAIYAWHHALPRDPAERRAFLFDAGVSLIDGLVTSAGTAHGVREMDPAVRPFVRGGFGEIVGSWVLGSALDAAITRHWSPAQRIALDDWGSEQHILGAASWYGPLHPYAYPVVIDGMAMPSTPIAPVVVRP